LNVSVSPRSKGTFPMNDETLHFLNELEDSVPPADPNGPLVASGERPCPICGDTMEVTTDYGINMDYCDDHGIWLDAGEMPKMLARIRSGERVSRKSAIRNARRDGKISGALFGTWSLMFD